MKSPRSAPVDTFQHRFRVQTLRTGIWPSLFTAGYFAAFDLWTWGRPHRGLLLALSVGAFGASLALVWLPVERVVRSRAREAFFLGWSASLIVLMVVAALLDGGAGSPFVVALFLPLVYSALSYPMASMLAVGAMVLLAYLGLALADGGVDPQEFLHACVLASATWICAWQARNHDRQRVELARISSTDPLTGCLNRRGFEERFAAELSDATRLGQPLSLVLFDLDDFKRVNDTAGHAAGDALLCHVASTLQGNVRATDPVGRLGGDEFAVLLRRQGDPAELVERLLEQLAPSALASAGTASFPLDALTPAELHAVADAELYDRKHDRRPRGTGRELSWAAALASTVDERMAVQHQHSHAVAELATAIATRLGWGEADLGLLRLAAMLHDVGKVRVPEELLRKPGPLDPDEYAQVAEHAAAGAEIVARVEGLQAIAPWVRHSHERIDGGGYPDGLSGEAIPLASRILLVADGFDAMTSDRSYRRACSPDEALEELHRHAGRQFDVACVEALAAELLETGIVPDAAAA